MAETQGPVPIFRRNEEVAYIISKEDYLKISESQKKECIIDRIHASRAAYGLDDSDDFDYTEYFDSLRGRNYYGRDASHLFDQEMHMRPIYLLDTNIISEFYKPFPNKNVYKKINEYENVSAIS